MKPKKTKSPMRKKVTLEDVWDEVMCQREVMENMLLSTNAIFERLNGRGSVEVYDDDEEVNPKGKELFKAFLVARDIGDGEYDYFAGRLHSEANRKKSRPCFVEHRSEADRFTTREAAEQMADDLRDIDDEDPPGVYEIIGVYE